MIWIYQTCGVFFSPQIEVVEFSERLHKSTGQKHVWILKLLGKGFKEDTSLFSHPFLSPPFRQDLTDLLEKGCPFFLFCSLTLSLAMPCVCKRPGLGCGSTAPGARIRTVLSILFSSAFWSISGSEYYNSMILAEFRSGDR